MPAWTLGPRAAAWLHWVATGAGGGASFAIGRWMFLRVLGVICAIAFVSFWVQCSGLIGSNGILPARSFLRAVDAYFGAGRHWRLPTVFWFNCSDAALQTVCALGTGASALLILGVAPAPNLVLIWACYLSLVAVGQDFMSFQWDALLIETCFLAVWLAPWHLRPGLAAERAVCPLALWLMWWLLFRLMFESGVVKLTSGDPVWRNLTALNYHYFTQPLPTWVAWYANVLPGGFQKGSVVVMYIVEIGLPFLIFLPAPFRYIACAGIVFLMALIMITGNYNFFNLLTMALALLLVDDGMWLRLLPARLLRWIGAGAAERAPAAWGLAAPVFVLAVLFFLVGGLQVWRACRPRDRATASAIARLNVLQSLQSLNSYGLFRVMTRSRSEIVVEGSRDGEVWAAYEFKYKPGDVRRRPAFVEPHQPRLDWQMWFAALGTAEDSPWFERFCLRLLEGQPAVLALLARNPYPDRPPRYLRARLYDYRFTTPAERRASGAWWKRELIGVYAPVMQLRRLPADPR